MNPRVTVSVAQYDPQPDAAANRRRIAEQTAQASAAGSRLVVFPEEAMLRAEPLGDALAEVVEREWPAFLTFLSALAAEHGVWIVAGAYEPSGTSRPFNTLVVVDDAGSFVESYRKLHLYDAFAYRESDYVTAGDQLPPVILIDGVAFGLINCYDLRFPELARSLVDRGADVLSISAAWVAGLRKEDHWTTLVRARAIENTCWVLAASSASPDCIGTSMVVDPLGVERTVMPPTGSALATVEISLDRIAEVRHQLPALANRRLRVGFDVVPAADLITDSEG